MIALEIGTNGANLCGRARVKLSYIRQKKAFATWLGERRPRSNFPRSPVDKQDRSSGFSDRLREDNFQGRCVCSEIVLADVNRDLSIQESGAERRGNRDT